jgi:hypothetical protein
MKVDLKSLAAIVALAVTLGGYVWSLYVRVTALEYQQRYYHGLPPWEGGPH